MTNFRSDHPPDGELRIERVVAQVRALGDHPDGLSVQDAEEAYLAALGATTRYEIAGTTLTLFGPDGPVVRLELANAPPS
jgi:hypothetical protein